MKSSITSWGLALGLTLAIWAVLTWPLPLRFSDAIPSSAYNIEKHGQRAMVHGDHLQFLYHLWLGADVLRGGTPPFYNLYEFNTGNDQERYSKSLYYLPFSIFFFAGSLLGSQAAGWNLMGFVSLLLTFWATARLTRRFCEDAALAWIAALISILLPYRWITLLDGSPSGLCMMWVPLIFWGLDVWVRDRRAAGAWGASLAILFAGWSDSHVYFFTILAAPFWCLFAYLNRRTTLFPSRAEWGALLKSAWPFVLLALAIWWQTHGVKEDMSSSVIGTAGRSRNEVALWSYSLSGVFQFVNPGDSRKIYLGAALVALMSAGLIAYLVRSRNDARRPLTGAFWPVLLLNLGILGVVILSSGLKNPGGDRAWSWLIKLIPPYAMIRQPDKIFTLLPTLLAVNLAFVLPALVPRGGPRGARRATYIAPITAALLLIPAAGDFAWRIRPTLCLLDRDQAAYRAVAEEARAAGQRPHILALPLWPGDSHFTSVYQYYASLYRIRMVNGYRATARIPYLEKVFQPLEGMNKGFITDAQLDRLLSWGVNHIVLHEDLFPEKVSPFPVGRTLEALLNHPRLRLSGHERSVWSFAILPAAHAAPRPPVTLAPIAFPARRWEMEEASMTNGARRVEDITARSGAAVALESPGAMVETPDAQIPMDRPAFWMIRARGNARLHVAPALAPGETGTAFAPETVSLRAAEGWTWLCVPLPVASRCPRAGLRVTWVEGRAQLDYALLMAGEWKPPAAAGDALELPATAFFHAGHTRNTLDAVVLDPDYDPEAIVFYGPMLPLEPGRYRFELDFESTAPAGTQLGRFNIRRRGTDEHGWVEVTAGTPATAIFNQPDNLPLFLAFVFERNGPMAIRSVRIVRMGPESKTKTSEVP